jgi:para-nitrobenzyl esterase
MKFRCAALVMCVAATAAIKEPVRVESGLLSGAAGGTAGVRVFKGVPFAAPPVGDLRWRAPQAPVKWDGVRKADQFGKACMQPPQNKGSFYQKEFYPADEPVSEDCLFLNIWTAAQSAKERRPVMVWIHGGAYREGSGSLPSFDGDALAKKGVVLVTINYRMGAFGFLAHPELTKESGHSASGNYALMDQMAALQWVKTNITAFGGDAGRVTVFGQSAGAGSVSSLMASPLARGLFQRAIGQSSGISGGPGAQKLADAEQTGVKFGESMNASSIAALRAKSADEVQKAGQKATMRPVVDGYVLPSDVYSIFASGKFNDVPVMVGSTAGEGGLNAGPKSAQDYVEQARRTYGDMADEYLKVLPGATEAQAKESAYAAARDRTAAGMRTWARMVTKAGKPAYLYYFDRKPPGRDSERIGAFHSAELVYVFGTQSSVDRPWEPVDRELSARMIAYWANFAAKADPNGKGLPKWPVYRADQSVVMELGDKVGAMPTPDPAVLDFFDAYAAKQRAR